MTPESLKKELDEILFHPKLEQHTLHSNENNPAVDLIFTKPETIVRRLGVIGNDERQDVTSWTTPYHSNVYIQSSTALGTSRCSGALITPIHVLTAGHCISDGSGNFYWDHTIIASLVSIHKHVA